jgi:hypothetical protein
VCAIVFGDYLCYFVITGDDPAMRRVKEDITIRVCVSSIRRMIETEWINVLG